ERSLTHKEITHAGNERRLPNMKKNTQEMYIRGIKMLFDWAEREEYIQRSPARDIKALGSDTPAKDARDPFTSEELKLIFSAPLYSGCQSDKEGYAIPGPERPRGTRFWIPLIALHSGMRLNEICQLRVTDFKQSPKGNYYFDVNDEDGKRVKNRPSKRRVPVHSVLLKLGILDFVRERANSGSQGIFKDIRMSNHGYYSERMSRWFNEGLSTSRGHQDQEEQLS